MGRAKGCIRYTVCFLAFLTWVLGGIVVGYMMWVLGTSLTFRRFFTGTLVFTYVTLGLGSMLCLNGLLGWLGSYQRGSCLMKLFLFVSVLLIASEIGGIIALSILKTKMTDILQVGWSELNQKTKNLIQEQFECCGFNGPSDFVDTPEPIDDSCYSSGAASSDPSDSSSHMEKRRMHQIGCREKLLDWFYANKIIWMACLGGFLLFQVITVLLTVYAINEMRSPRRGSSTQSFNEAKSITYM